MNHRIEGEERFPKAIICDLDGTLADHWHRRRLVDPSFDTYAYRQYEEVNKWGRPINPDKFEWFTKQGERWKPNWEAFYGAIDKDEVNKAIHEIIWSLGAEILFVTGRPEKYREITKKWLSGLGLCYELFMRPDFLPIFREDSIDPNTGEKKVVWPTIEDAKPDHRPASEVKREIYENHIMGKYDVLFALDDDEDCCQMYRSLGITTLKVVM